ncbi:MAG: crossover junction endodeoxyribonuclease RuvC [Clostridia bacterium]|nr:crossover junction endodeoxyribonuclease RuvC [Clostridia bacterium]
MKILGIDPGYAIVGYGVIEYSGGKYSPVDFGAITTEADMPFPMRLQHIYNEIVSVIINNDPDEMAIERLYFQNNQKTAIAVAEARGVILLAAQMNNIAISEYTPLQVKQAVTGYGQAKKPQVMEMTRRLLKLESVPKPDDTADALAMAICHAQCSGTRLRNMLNSRNTIKTNGFYSGGKL